MKRHCISASITNFQRNISATASVTITIFLGHKPNPMLNVCYKDFRTSPHWSVSTCNVRCSNSQQIITNSVVNSPTSLFFLKTELRFSLDCTNIISDWERKLGKQKSEGSPRKVPWFFFRYRGNTPFSWLFSQMLQQIKIGQSSFNSESQNRE